MNQHVDRRAILASSVAAATALAVAAPSRQADAGEIVSLPQYGAHPDAELFQLEAEMEVASARLKKIERSQSRKSKKAEKEAGPRPLHPMDWKEPAMPNDLWELKQSALDQAKLADLKDGNWRPAPVMEWQEKVDRERDLIKAEWDRFCERLNEQHRLLGYDAGESEFTAACDEEWQIGKSIFAVPAHTIDGMLVKLRASDRLRLEEYANANDAHASIAADIRRLAGQGARISLVPATDQPAMPSPEIPRDELLRAYSEWLHYERQMLMRDIYPDQNMQEMMRYVPANTRAGLFHFPLYGDPRGTWDTLPAPATRAFAVMAAAGVDLMAGKNIASA